MKKVGIYIDGRNFEIGAMELLGVKNNDNLEKLLKIFNINTFIENITKNQEVIFKNFYRGIPTPSLFDKKLCRNVGAFVNSLSKKGFKIHKGHFTRQKTEKGVDVRLALDIVRDSRDKKIDIIFLFSNDTDLLEAIKDVKSHGVKVFHCIFKVNSKFYSANNALSVNSCKRLVLNRQLLQSKIN